MSGWTEDCLGQWLEVGLASFRVTLWDTGDSDSYGKCRLRYEFVIFGNGFGEEPVTFTGDDFFPSPFQEINSDEAAGALLSFFAAYGETIAYGGDDVPEDLTPRQREALGNHHDAISVWSHELDPQP